VLSCEQEGAICSGKKVHVQDQERCSHLLLEITSVEGVLETTSKRKECFKNLKRTYKRRYNKSVVKRTLITIGNSIAVTIPREYLDRHGLHVGDTVELEATERGIIIRPERVLDADFERAFRAVARRYRGTLSRLAERDRQKKP
jgi:antitoxin component of MazEF toxin-antitoxin module